MSTVSDTSGPGTPRLFRRSGDDHVLVGVAGGLGRDLGVDPLLVRMGFAILLAAGGIGALLYAAAWALSAAPAAAAPSRPRLPRARQIVAVGSIVLGTLLVCRSVGLWFGDAVVWPVVLAVAGSALIWARTEEGARPRPTWLGERLPGDVVRAAFSGRMSPLRVLAGALLVVAGIAAFLAAHSALPAAGSAALAAGVTAAGLGLLLGPWITRLAREAAEERRQRVRSEERAEIAAHLHDSVLHTLALIQKSEAPADVTALARRQERELRAWLGGRPSVADEADLRGAVDAMASRVEEHHRITVDTVVVGEAAVDERLRALLDACQEAATNAARHSGAAQVSVYVEADGDGISAYVRDQGCGFDPQAVPADRRGIAESIVGRMRRNGGTATVESSPGAGTEVQLHLPRARS